MYFIHTFKKPKVIMFGCNVALKASYVILWLYKNTTTEDVCSVWSRAAAVDPE